jgi:gamma-glutamylcyclotransferase (GGCT)/AIG2-like uncharacterized protein YtfP
MLYFGYGSNLNIRQMENRCSDAKKIGPAYLSDHRLVFRGVADIEYKENCQCPGGLWEISESDLEKLDHYEGYPNLYDRYRTMVMLGDGTNVEAIVYEKNDQTVKPPNAGYFNTILEGYDDFDLNTDHLVQAKDRAEKQFELDYSQPGQKCHAF